MRTLFSKLSRFLLIAAFAGALAACKTELYSSVPERDANEMISVLAQAGISASRERAKGGGFTVSVAQEQVGQAVGVLNQKGLPRQQFENLGTIFDAKKMVSTPFEERARFMHAMNQELANSLTRIAGVVSARVHIMMPDASPLDRSRQQPRASVFVYHQPGIQVGQYVPLIKNLVVNSVNGMAYEDVAVGLFPAAVTPAQQASPFAAIGLPGANQTLLIVLGAVLLGMFLFRRSIGRAVNGALARS
jgi:type III secretion protein J